MSQDVHTSTCQHVSTSACQSVSDKYTISGIRYYYEKFSLKYIYRRTYWLPIGYWSQLIYYYQVRNIYYVNFK